MNVKKWGPSGWIFLHTISFNYPKKAEDKDKTRYTKHIENVGHNLPCKYCRQSYVIYTKYLNIEPFLNDIHGVTYHLYRLHDLVNKKLFVKSPPFVDVVRKYMGFKAKCSTKIKDGDKDKKYNTCQTKVSSDEEMIQEFSKIAIDKYKDIADKMVYKLYQSSENPNKECEKYYEKLKKENKFGVYKIEYNDCNIYIENRLNNDKKISVNNKNQIKNDIN